VNPAAALAGVCGFWPVFAQRSQEGRFTIHRILPKGGYGKRALTRIPGNQTDQCATGRVGGLSNQVNQAQVANMSKLKTPIVCRTVTRLP